MRITCIIVLYLLCLPIRSAAQQHAYARSVQLYRDNKLDSAGYYARQAIGLYTKTARKDSLVLAYTQQALITWDAESAEAALKIMDTAIRLSKQLPAQHVATVAAFSRAGQIYVQQQDFNKAATLLQFAAQAVPKRDTMNRHIVFLYNNTAILYLMQDEYDKARPWAQRAYQLNLKLQGKDGQDMPSLLQTNYYISQYSEQYQQALAEGKELQRVMLLHYPPGHRAIGILHNSLGNIYEALLQYEEALYHRRKALDIQFANYQQKKNNGFSLASAYQNLGNLYSYINEHFLAQEYLAKGSALFEQVYGPDEAGMIKILVGVADNKRKLGAWTEAEKLFGRAYALQQKHGPTDADAMAYVETFYGDLYLDQQQFAKAEQYYRLALKHFEQAGAMQTRLALQTQEALATVLSGKGQYDAALHLSKKVVTAFRNIYPKGNDGIAEKLQNISVIYLAAGQSANALAYSDSVFCELTGRSHLPQDGSWVGKLPFSYNTSLYIRHRMKLLQGRAVLQLADRYTQYIATHLPAFRTQATLKDLSAVHKHLYATAIETCWELGLPEKALGYSEQSKALLLRLAANNLLADAGGSSDPVTERDHQFRKRIGELNARYLNEGGDSVLHLLTGAIEQYRIFQDSIRTSGNTALAARYRLEPYSLQDIRSKLLRHGETLLEYTVTGEWVFLFVVNDKVCRMQRIPRKALADIHTLRQLSGLSPEAFAAPAFHLYNALVQPAVAHVNRKRLLVVPDGELFYLNFELLLSRNNAARFADMPYLVRDYNISYLLSATSAIQLNEGHTGRANDKALLFTPVFTDEMKDLYRQRNTSEQEYLYLHRQPFALEAARQIGRIVPNDLYAEQQAQEQTFKQAAPGYRVLHLGTHAALNDAAQLHSRLYFAQAAPGDSANTEDGYLHAYEIYAMQLHADLAVLTACETGAGALQEGEGILSLSHSFMYAGCKSVIMSGWKIDEKTSMKVITGCYDYLSKGYTKSEALRKAKLDLLDSDPRLAHPYYWAGLTLIGDDSVVYKRPYTLFWLAGGVLLLLAAGGWYWRKSSAYRA